MGLGDGFLPSGNTSSPKPMETQIHVVRLQWANPSEKKSFKKIIFIFISNHFATLKHGKLLKFTHKEDKNTHITHGQYHGYWWPGDAMNRGINGKVIDLVCPEHSGFSTRMYKTIQGPMVCILDLGYHCTIDDVIKWKYFPRYWPFVKGIPLTKASDAELWCCSWSVPEQTVEQKIETPMIMLIMTSIMKRLKVLVHQSARWWLKHSICLPFRFSQLSIILLIGACFF